MTTFPETIIANNLKLYRGHNAMTTDEIVAEILVRLAQEGWKFMHSSVDAETLERAEVTKKQYALLYHALKER